MRFFSFFAPSIWLNIMKRVFSFGHLKIRKSNSDAAYQIGYRILELTSAPTRAFFSISGVFGLKNVLIPIRI